MKRRSKKTGKWVRTGGRKRQRPRSTAKRLVALSRPRVHGRFVSDTKAVDLSETVLRCPFCKETFIGGTSLKRHINSRH